MNVDIYDNNFWNWLLNQPNGMAIFIQAYKDAAAETAKRLTHSAPA